MNVPTQVPVMPLPNTILFPRVLLPLHIFEERYKLMLEDCLRGDRMFAVALQRKGAAQPQGIATVGVIRACLGQDDGTSNLVLEGVTRVAISEYVQVRPYRLAQVRHLTSVGDTEVLEREPLLAAVRKLARLRSRLGSKLPRGMLSTLKAVPNTDQLSDLVSYTLLENFRDKQLMLETLDVGQRLTKLVELLQAQIRQFELWKTLQGDLSNDDVGNN